MVLPAPAAPSRGTPVTEAAPLTPLEAGPIPRTSKTVLSLLLPLLAFLALAAAPAHASRNQTLFFEAPGDLLNDATRDASFQKLDSLGVSGLRIAMLWRSVAPAPDSRTQPDFDTTDPAAYDFAAFDKVLDAAKQRNWPVLLTVTGPVPKWATRDRKDNVSRPDPNKFAQFMTAVGRHFAGRVAYWSIWNEPNQPQFLQPQYDGRGRPVSPGIYRRLYEAALKGLKSAQVSRPQVLMGETSPTGNSHVVAPLAFLRGVLCLNASYQRTSATCSRLSTAGYAHHAYTPKAGPFFVPPKKDNVSIGVLPRLTSALDRAGRAGAIPRNLPLFLTEFGIQSAPDVSYGVPFQRQSEYRAISERIAYANPRVKSFSQYLLTDDQPDLKARFAAARYPGFESGLITYKGKEKPSFDAFRLALAVRPSTKTTASIWGEVRPARAAGTAQLEYRSGSSGAFQPLKSVSYNRLGFFTTSGGYRTGRQYRVTWTAPDGTVYHGGATRAYHG
ncbi:MAG: hypothetical protein JWM31_522 [Solirubrobacterales bacterium]|nr:hypothetical protein [Solirubrobacterales bacterium]